jgi:hypothetical protein
VFAEKLYAEMLRRLYVANIPGTFNTGKAASRSIQDRFHRRFGLSITG